LSSIAGWHGGGEDTASEPIEPHYDQRRPMREGIPCSRHANSSERCSETAGAFASSRINGEIQRGYGGPLASRSKEGGSGLPYENSGIDCRRRRAAATSGVVGSMPAGSLGTLHGQSDHHTPRTPSSSIVGVVSGPLDLATPPETETGSAAASDRGTTAG